MIDENKHLYIQLANSIKEKINTGEYRSGMPIMSERKMSEAYGLNRMTVRKAISKLIDEGFLISIQGKGTFVNTNQSTGKKIQFGTKESMSLSNELRQNGFSSTRIVLSLKEVKMTDELKDYFPKSETCYELIRLSSIDNDPYALQICYFPSFYFSSPERFNFADDSIYTYMELQGHKVNTTVSEMKCIPIPNDYISILQMNLNDQAFYSIYFGFDEEHKMVEYTKAYYKPKYTSFKLIVQN